MHLVQLLLPTRDNAGRAFAKTTFDRVRAELVGRFGGLTTYARAPAEGLWVGAGDDTVRDNLVVYEVVVESLDPTWWRQFVSRLEAEMQQDQLHVRALPVTLL